MNIRRLKRIKYNDRSEGFLRGFRAKRCRSYCEGCPVCEYWRFFDIKGRFPALFEELK